MAFLVFEGLDGSGKSSLMSFLEEELSRQGVSYLKTREPGGTPLGDEIRQMILRPAGPTPLPRTELLLYEASRAQHTEEVIRPALQEKKWVLCDRFSASSVAFQGGGRDISVLDVTQLNRFATGGLEADLTVLLDLPVEESRRRRQLRNVQTGSTEDRIEAEMDSFHEKVRQSFLQQSQQSSAWLVLDARLTPTELFQKLLVELAQREILKPVASLS